MTYSIIRKKDSLSFIVGFTISTGGIISLIVHNWIPIITGYSVFIIFIVYEKIKKAIVSINFPTISRKKINNDKEIRIFVMKYIKSNPTCKQIDTQTIRELAKSEMLKSYIKYNSLSLGINYPETIDVVNWFILLVKHDLKLIQSAPKEIFKSYINELLKSEINQMETFRKVPEKYGVNMETIMNNPSKHLKSFSKNDKSTFLDALFSNIITHSRFVILSTIYNDWYE